MLRLECTVCKYKMQLALKRCKQYVVFRSVVYAISSIRHYSFELGGEKKTKGAALQFVRGFCLIASCVSDTLVKVSCMSWSFLFRALFVMYPPPHYDMQSTTCSSPVVYTRALRYLTCLIVSQTDRCFTWLYLRARRRRMLNLEMPKDPKFHLVMTELCL